MTPETGNRTYQPTQSLPSSESVLDPDHVAGSMLITKSLAARILGISQITLDRMRKAGKFPPPVDVLSHRKLYWRREDVIAHIKNLRALPH